MKSSQHRDIAILKRAEHDLLALALADRVRICKFIDTLGSEAVPRGTEALHGRAHGHLRHVVDRFRVLYRVREDTVVIVAITGGPI